MAATISKAQAARTERDEAIARLREWIKPGDTLYTVLKHRAASGMSRTIDVYGFGPERCACGGNGDDPHVWDCARIASQNVRVGKSWYSYNIAHAGIGTWDDKREAIRIGGAGMDMGFHIVYELGAVLFPDGFGCVGVGCGSNDHTNGDRDYTPHMNGAPNTFTAGYVGHWHRDGGYALRQEWLG